MPCASKASTKVPKEKPFWRCEQPKCIDRTNVSNNLFTENLFNLRSSEVETMQDVAENCGSMDPSDGNISGRGRNSLNTLLKPKCSFHLVDFNACRNNQTEQQAAPANTFETVKIDACCVIVTRIQCFTTIIILHRPDTSTFFSFTPRLLDDPVSNAYGQAGVETAVSRRVKRALSDWIPVNGHLFAVQLNESVRFNSSQLKHHCLSVVSVYVSTDCSSSEVYRELHRLSGSVRSTEVLAVAGDLKTQPGHLAGTEKRMGG